MTRPGYSQYWKFFQILSKVEVKNEKKKQIETTKRMCSKGQRQKKKGNVNTVNKQYHVTFTFRNIIT